METKKNLVRCPSCLSGQLQIPHDAAGEVSCSACDATHPARDGVIDLIPEQRDVTNIWVNPWVSPRWCRNYERYRGGRGAKIFTNLLFEEECEILTRAVGLEADSTFLDIASGSGIFSRRLAHEVPEGHAFALDPDGGALRFAARAAREDGLSNLTQLRADARVLPFHDDTLDAITCEGGLHVMPELDRILKEFQRALRVGGRLVVATVLRRESGIGTFRDRMQRRVMGSGNFTPTEVARMLEKAGFAEPACHHADRVWLIMSAEKPG